MFKFKQDKGSKCDKDIGNSNEIITTSFAVWALCTYLSYMNAQHEAITFLKLYELIQHHGYNVTNFMKLRSHTHTVRMLFKHNFTTEFIPHRPASCAEGSGFKNHSPSHNQLCSYIVFILDKGTLLSILIL